MLNSQPCYQREEEIKRKELYRYLTNSDPTKLRSLQVTPAPSSDGGQEEEEESDEEGSGSESSGDTEQLESSGSEEEVEDR